MREQVIHTHTRSRPVFYVGRSTKPIYNCGTKRGARVHTTILHMCGRNAAAAALILQRKWTKTDQRSVYVLCINHYAEARNTKPHYRVLLQVRSLGWLLCGKGDDTKKGNEVTMHHTQSHRQ